MRSLLFQALNLFKGATEKSVLFEAPTIFKGKSENSILTVQNLNGRYCLSVSEQTNCEATRFTLDYLNAIIGADRLKRICSKPEIDIDLKKIENRSLILTKNIVRKIFVGLLDIQKIDLDELNKNTIIDDQFSNLINSNSFEDIESLFMGLCPKLENFKIDKPKTSGKAFEGLSERVYVLLQHHFMVINETEKKAAELRDIEMLTSRLADREIQKGEVVHLNEGFFYVDHVVASGGAYVFILKDIKGVNTPKIICRGTAIRPSATGGFKSGINDLLLEIGSMGVKSIWPEISKYLNENGIKSVELLGKSLGGAQAQELAILIESDAIEVKKLTTYCSVGVGNTMNSLFKNEVLQKRSNPFEIRVIRNGGNANDQIDYIPAIGGVHLGEGSGEKCNIEVCYIQPNVGEVGVCLNNIHWADLIKNFLRSFIYAHARQTTLNKFSWKKIDQAHIGEHLRTGNQLEKIRKCFAFIIHYLTFCLLNGHSFAFFLSDQKKVRAAKNLSKNENANYWKKFNDLICKF